MLTIVIDHDGGHACSANLALVARIFGSSWFHICMTYRTYFADCHEHPAPWHHHPLRYCCRCCCYLWSALPPLPWCPVEWSLRMTLPSWRVCGQIPSYPGLPDTQKSFLLHQLDLQRGPPVWAAFMPEMRRQPSGRESGWPRPALCTTTMPAMQLVTRRLQPYSINFPT